MAQIHIDFRLIGKLLGDVFLLAHSIIGDIDRTKEVLDKAVNSFVAETRINEQQSKERA